MKIRLDNCFVGGNFAHQNVFYGILKILFSNTDTTGSITLGVKVYEKGKQVHSVEQEMTEAEARATVTQLMDPEGINAQSFCDVQIIDAEGGVVRFALSKSFENSYKEQYEMSGMTMTAFEGYCEATLAEGVLTEYRYHMEMTLRVDGQTVKTKVNMTITFADGAGAETV